MFFVRVVLDTCVIVSALRSNNGASYRLLQLALDRKFAALTSSALFLEYEDVIRRPEHRRVHGLSEFDIAVFLKDLALILNAVEVHFRWRPQLRDAGDEMVLEAAINGSADLLVTHNVRHFSDAGRPFGLRIVNPAEALKELDR